MRTLLALFGILATFTAIVCAQDSQSTYCSFSDDNQVSIQYNPTVKDPPHNGKVWSPGITLFVQTPLQLGNSTIGLGAYSVHLIPDKKAWTIIVNRNVKSGAPYESAQDVARASMEVGELPQAVNTLQLSFGHMAPKQCSLRVYFQKTGAFAEFSEK